VADAILWGMVRRSPVIVADTKPRLLAKVAGGAPGFTRLYMNTSTRLARREMKRHQG